MADANPPRTTLMAQGTATVRQRPSVLLMTIPLRASEATLELGLAKLKKRCEATAGWLRRLNAVRVEFGEPYFADQATPKDPVRAMRAATARAMGKPAKPPSDESRRKLGVTVTATWDIAALSAEQTLVFVDQLRFEATPDPDPAETADPAPTWTTPEEQMQQLMAQMAGPPEEEVAPQILFVTRLTDEQMERAYAEAVGKARAGAERLARAAGRRLGELGMLNVTAGGMAVDRPDRLMERQRCMPLLADSTYQLGEHETVSDDPRSSDYTVAAHVSYHLE